MVTYCRQLFFHTKMAANRPFWIRSKFGEHGYHPCTRGYLNTKFQLNCQSHSWDKGGDRLQTAIFPYKDGRQSVILNHIKIWGTWVSPLHYGLFEYQVSSKSPKPFLRYRWWQIADSHFSKQRWPPVGHFESDQNFWIMGITFALGLIWIPSFK